MINKSNLGFGLVLGLLGSLCIAACQNRWQTLHSDELLKYVDTDRGVFQHGVASGDPQQDAIILWTRVSPAKAQSLNVSWELAETKDFKSIIQSGQQLAKAETDFTVKVDVTGLQTGSTYFYRFKVNDQVSPVGRTKTLPQDPTQIKLAVVSCSNFEAGYFNAYANIAAREDVDCVVHLGDYIYEYGVGTYGDTTLGRLNVPEHEIVTISDYRIRYSQYRMDADLKAVHQMHPFITIWDDHEIANNAYHDGAQNHQAEEGSYDQRKSVARQVYYEWMPIRNSDQHYRSFDFGRLAKLVMLDERLAGRTAPVDSLQDASYASSDRTMLGEDQRNWFLEEMREQSTWKVIGNQVIFSNLNFGPNHWNEVNLDAWDGWPAEQRSIKQFLETESVGSAVFITGDTHSSWAIETPGPSGGSGGPVAVEIGVTSVSSSNMGDGNAEELVEMRESEFKKLNPHLKFVSLKDHGYVLLTMTQSRAVAEFIYVESVKKKSDKEAMGKSFVIPMGGNVLKER